MPASPVLAATSSSAGDQPVDSNAVAKALGATAAAKDATPIIMLTAKVEDVDRIVGLEVGADDYLPKPFNPRELLARIHAVLRRRPLMEAPGAPAREPQTVTFGPFEFDLALRRLTREGEVISLTTGEFSLIKVLVQHARRPLARDRLARGSGRCRFCSAAGCSAASPTVPEVGRAAP